ncbi:DUF5979 domain-containing protein [Corynebacterium kutscheri]|uniref:LPxTG domain-containing protein n=1 Tax=Corynebacterium kutscheri TaxID=35755 RepID=A0AB38VRD8_9CORY|nr:DUF5979 domain-containing protein [Corynebacterium kutscheri]VEH06087.1 LPxTG domain-containing protein [Corynebacterium kutscheri]
MDNVGSATVLAAREQRWRSSFIAVLVVIGMIFALIPFAPPTQAAERAADYITEAQISREQSKESPLYAGSAVYFAFKWDASEYYSTEKAPQAGDTMTVSLPSWAKFADAIVDMKDDEGNILATCVQAPTIIVCTFTDFVEGKIDLHGDYKTAVYLQETQTITPTQFPVGSADVIVDITSIATPDVIDKGIIKHVTPQPKFEILSGKASKHGHFFGVRSKSDGQNVLRWSIVVPGTGGNMVVTDTFTNNQQRAKHFDRENIRESVEVRYRDREAEGNQGGYWNLDTDIPAGTAKLLDHSLYTTTWTEVDGQARLEVSIPDTNKDYVYDVIVFTTIAADGVKNGDKVSNTAYIDGKLVNSVVTARNTVNAYGEGREGFGNIYIYKTVVGMDKAPADYVAKIKAELTYLDSKTETRIIEVKPGTTIEQAGKILDLPAGTEVTLSEADATDIPGYTKVGVEFGEGKDGTTTGSADVKISEDKTSISVIVRDAGNTDVGVSNIYLPVKAQIGLTKVIQGEAKTLVADDHEFDVQASWTDEAGVPQERTLKIVQDEVTLLEELPLGTVVTLKELLPTGTTPLVWATPRYSTDRAGVNLKDNGDGTATVVVSETPDNKVALVSVENSASRQEGQIGLTKVVGGLAAGSSQGSSQNPREFDIQASWVDTAGAKQERTLKITEGKTTLLEKLPVGTVVTLKEIMPENTAITSWSTPGYSSDNTTLKLTDNGDGTATVVIPATDDKPVVVTVNNTANIPWWWLLLPLAPLFIPPILSGSSDGSSGSSQGSSATTTVVPPTSSTPVTSVPPKTTVPSEKPTTQQSLQKRLAETGASVLGMLGFAVALLLAGLGFVVLSRKRNK